MKLKQHTVIQMGFMPIDTLTTMFKASEHLKMLSRFILRDQNEQFHLVKNRPEGDRKNVTDLFLAMDGLNRSTIDRLR